MRKMALVSVVCIVIALVGVPLSRAAQETIQVPGGAVVVKLEHNDFSGVWGTAALTAVGDKTRVSVKLEVASSAPRPPMMLAGINKGTCDLLTTEKPQDLTEFDEDGQSLTKLDVPLTQLDNHAVVISYKNGVTACGEVVLFEPGDTVTVALKEYNVSGVKGTAVLTDHDDVTSLAIELAGLNAVDEFTGLLRAGSCAGFLNDATFDLEPIEYSSYGSRTVLANVLENLGGWSIVLFYEDRPDRYAACGDIDLAA